jgi:hypothetical protein
VEPDGTLGIMQQFSKMDQLGEVRPFVYGIVCTVFRDRHLLFADPELALKMNADPDPNSTRYR